MVDNIDNNNKINNDNNIDEFKNTIDNFNKNNYDNNTYTIDVYCRGLYFKKDWFIHPYNLIKTEI